MKLAKVVGVACVLAGTVAGAAELPSDMEKVYQSGSSFLATNGDAYTLKQGWLKHHENVAVAPDCDAGTVLWDEERVKVSLLVDEEGLDAPATMAAWAYKCQPEAVADAVGFYRQAVEIRDAEGRVRAMKAGQAIQNAGNAYADGYRKQAEIYRAASERSRGVTTTCSPSGPNNVVCKTR